MRFHLETHSTTRPEVPRSGVRWLLVLPSDHQSRRWGSQVWL